MKNKYLFTIIILFNNLVNDKYANDKMDIINMPIIQYFWIQKINEKET